MAGRCTCQVGPRSSKRIRRCCPRKDTTLFVGLIRNVCCKLDRTNALLTRGGALCLWFISLFKWKILKQDKGGTFFNRLHLQDPVLAPDGVLQLRPVNSFVKTIFGAKGGVVSGDLTPDGDRHCRPTTPQSHLECDVSKVGL